MPLAYLTAVQAVADAVAEVDSSTVTKKSALLFLAVSSLALASEGPRIVPAGTDPKLVAAIRKANSEFEVAMAKADTAAIVAPYAMDAVFVGIDGTAFQGRARIEQLYRDRFAKSGPALETKIESEQILLAGEFAYESGRGTIKVRGKEGETTSRARFLTVWQRQAGGGWMIYRNVVLPDR